MTTEELLLPGEPAPAPDLAAQQEARRRQARLTKPAGALGRLEELSIWLAGVRGCCPPPPAARPRVVVFAGDHGIAAAGVSAYPAEVTAQMMANILAGGAAVNVLARQVGATVRVLDLAVATDLLGAPAETMKHKVRAGSGRIDREDALSRRETETAIAAGRAIADEEIDAGADLLIAGDMGIGNTTPATVLVALLTGAEPHTLVGRGTGIDDAAWIRKTRAVRDAVRRGRSHLEQPARLVGVVGGADFAAMAGFLARAAERRTPVVLDGVVSAAAALVADRLTPGARAWWVAGHRSTEPAHTAALAELGLLPLLDLGLRLGEGTGALLALPLLQSAAATLAEMATFDEAGVSDQQPTG
ncbi:MAG: nicotinate-nucleotide--dimethylbenzimidazole phosphoribosyltransferase [Frankiales bacterium]|nr:nicotinate-nucleotide--dimethylbenzimidazole phosphoribosyltransferase [Frankiales bacterium]